MLYVPLQLLPRYSEVPLLATITPHNPVELSQVILQPITSDTTGISKVEELDLKDMISQRARAEGSGMEKPNGHMNGHVPHNDSQLRILREGHHIVIPTKTDRQNLPFRIIMLEPVAQGFISHRTRVILSTDPYNPDADIDGEDGEGSIFGQSSHGKTHLSMADFDPDAFLSSSLALALHPSSNDDYIEEETERSVSSTSGSITPRPPGAAPIPSSPPARLHQMDDPEEIDGVGGGTKFGAVGACGAVDGRHGVCWVSVGGLGRAGIFEGDWVSWTCEKRGQHLTIRFS
jgi:peroxin-6